MRRLEVDEKQPQRRRLKNKPGPAYRWDLRTAGEFLADAWVRHTDRSLVPHPRRGTGGPFAKFLRAALQVIEPRVSATKLAREIYDSRRQRKRLDTLERKPSTKGRVSASSQPR
jgi:hypothetical protein